MKNLREFELQENIDFYVIDLESANQSYASICQVGIASIGTGSIQQCWGTFVNPQEEFAHYNTKVHGITADKVKDSALFPETYEKLKLLEGKFVAHHGNFDRSSMNQACDKHNLPKLKFNWIDSTLIARKTWTELDKKGYGLGALAKRFSIEFEHHNAVEDAKVAGEIILKAIEQSNISIDVWFRRCRK